LSQTIQGPYVAPNPPTAGTDPAIQVYASLGAVAIPVTVQTQGAANLATTQLTVSNSAQQIFALRATRRSAVITNTDPTNTIYAGTAAVTASTGQAILPLTSLGIPTTAAIYLISSAGSPVATGAEAYD